VLDLEPETIKTSRKRRAKSPVAIGSSGLQLVPVAFEFALRNQRSEVRILLGVFGDGCLTGAFSFGSILITVTAPALVGKEKSVSGQISEQEFLNHSCQGFRCTLQVVFIRVNVNVRSRRQLCMAQLHLGEFDVVGLSPHDAAAGVAEDVKSMRP
jgi:hypothetical protein